MSTQGWNWWRNRTSDINSRPQRSKSQKKYWIQATSRLIIQANRELKTLGFMDLLPNQRRKESSHSRAHLRPLAGIDPKLSLLQTAVDFIQHLLCFHRLAGIVPFFPNLIAFLLQNPVLYNYPTDTLEPHALVNIFMVKNLGIQRYSSFRSRLKAVQSQTEHTGL